MRPKILLSLPSTGRTENYLEAVEAAGGNPTGLYAPEVDLQYDGLVLCGGPDLEPELYGQKNCGSVGIEAIRDQAELALARVFIAIGKPVFGICRGLQLLNVVFGGTLVQDLPNKNLHTSGGKGDLLHSTWTAEGSVVYSLFGKNPITNSAHHQAIACLGNGLMATQWSEGGAVIEAFEHKLLPVLAVQWHPERLCCQNRRGDTFDALPIFEYFVAQCQR